MRVDEERFYDSIKALDRERLLSYYVDLHKKYEELLLNKNASDRITTEGVIQFQKLKKDYNEALAKIEQLEKTVKKLSDQLGLKNRAIFGRATEKFIDTLMSSEKPPEEFEDESQKEDCYNSSEEKHTVITLSDYKKQSEKDKCRNNVISPNKSGDKKSGTPEKGNTETSYLSP